MLKHSDLCQDACKALFRLRKLMLDSRALAIIP